MTTRCVIYARYSSDKQKDTSIDDQIFLCRDYARQKGWKVVDTYPDPDLTSGLKPEQRPECARLLQDAKTDKFDVVLVQNMDRLTGDLEDTAGTYKRLSFHRKEIHTCDFGHITRDRVGLIGTFNDMRRQNIGFHTRRGLMARAAEGKHTGGPLPYGYRKVGEDIQIDDKQANVVRRVYRDLADGRGYREIALRLNDEGVPSSSGGMWRSELIQKMFKQKVAWKYVGQWDYGSRQYERHPDTRKRQAIKRDKPLVEKEIPHLRIIDKQTWDKVQKRLADDAAAQAERVRKRKNPKTRPGAMPRYLLTGIAKCSVCGSNYSKTSGEYYYCATRKASGETACTNGKGVHRKVLEEKILRAIKTKLFPQRIFKDVEAKIRRALDQRLKERNRDPAKRRRELKATQEALENVTAAIAEAGHSRALLKELATLEAREKALETELNAELPAVADTRGLFEHALVHWLEMAENLEDFAGRDISKARNLIKSLVGGSIVLEPTDGGGLQARMQGCVPGLLSLVEASSSRSQRNTLRSLVVRRTART